jgi:Xaa-Pro dipeptidase
MATEATLAERDLRFQRIRTAMEAAGLDALVVAGKGHWWTGRGYFRYLTDFHLWGHDGLILLPLAGEPTLVLSSYAVAERIGRRGWITDTHGDVYLVPTLAGAIQEKGLARSRIGIAGYNWIMGAGLYEQLSERFPHVEWLDADDLLDRVRMIRSPLEIQQIRELWDLSKAAMERFVEVVEPGRSQRDLAAEASKLVLAGGGRDILVFMGEADDAVDIPQEVPVRCDGLLRYHMEICGPSGHWSEITVNLAFREPSTLERKLMESELRAFEEIRRMAKPGARLSEMAATFERVLQEDGWQLGPPTNPFDFHGQGMDTIERPWHAAAKGWGQSQDWPLEAGMTFSFHPHRKVEPKPGWGTGLNEDVLITENGIERFAGDWEHRWRMIR